MNDRLPASAPGAGDAQVPTSLARLILCALTDPDALELEDLAPLATAGPANSTVRLTALAAVAAGRPDLVGLEHLHTSLDGVDDPALLPLAQAALEALAGDGDAESVLAWLAEAPTRSTLRHALQTPLCRIIEWRQPKSLTVERLCSFVAGLPLDDRERALAEVAGHATDRLRIAPPHPAWRELEAVFGQTERWRTVAREAAPRAHGPGGAVRLQDASPLSVALELRHLLVVQNVLIGQGDELIRVGPIVQGMLAANPELRITVLTPRPHLYDHPRVEPLSIRNDVDVERALALPADAVFELYEAAAVVLNLRSDLHARLAERLATEPPRLLLRADVGFNQFLFSRVLVAGDDLTAEVNLQTLQASPNRPPTILDGIYEPLRRLLIGLGLPWLPAGSDRGSDPHTATPSLDAARLWRGLAGDGARPVAVVWPFGGSHELKGFPRDRIEELAQELTDLVEEGWRLVLLPASTPWASEDVVSRLLALLPDGARAHVAVAPDPAAPAPAHAALGLVEHPELAHADRVVRLFKYFAAYAERVITIEGWLGHLAAQMGRPLRLVLMAGSFGPEWYPPGDCEVGSTLARRPTGVRGRPRIAASAPAPLPRRARKAAFCAALERLGETSAPATVVDLAEHAFASLDETVRAAALRSLATSVDEDASFALVCAGLRDRHSMVRAAAAELLLRSKRAPSSERRDLGRAVLEAHIAIAAQRWIDVDALGDAALPAIAVAMSGEDEPVRREARWAMWHRLSARPIRP